MAIMRVGEIQMHYEIIGHGEPVVFIHGLGSSARDWENQIGFFSKIYQVTSLMYAGMGNLINHLGRIAFRSLAEI
jgi:pimeloyl-ACP methyl ester carboxylesterase